MALQCVKEMQGDLEDLYNEIRALEEIEDLNKSFGKKDPNLKKNIQKYRKEIANMKRVANEAFREFREAIKREKKK